MHLIALLFVLLKGNIKQHVGTTLVLTVFLWEFLFGGIFLKSLGSRSMLQKNRLDSELI